MAKPITGDTPSSKAIAKAIAKKAHLDLTMEAFKVKTPEQRRKGVITVITYAAVAERTGLTEAQVEEALNG